MAVRNAAGTVLTKTAFMATLTEVTTPTLYTAGADTVYDFVIDGADGYNTGRRLLVAAGHTIDSDRIDELFPPATFVSVVPATGAEAGGTAVVITGTNLDGVTGVTFGGEAATDFVLVSNTEITCTTPAGTGAVNIVLADDYANVTATSAFTYA